MPDQWCYRRSRRNDEYHRSLICTSAIYPFKRRTTNQLTPHLRLSPRCYNAHHDHYKRFPKIPTTTNTPPLHHKPRNCYQPLQPHHHNRLNHLQRFTNLTADTTALTPPHYNHRNCHQVLGRLQQSLGMPGNGEQSRCMQGRILRHLVWSANVH